MLIILILLSLAVLGIVMAIGWEDLDILGSMIAATAGVFLFVALISLPINRYDVQSNLAQIEATRTTLESLRSNGTDLEDAAIQHKVIEANQWIASTQYYRTTIFKLWYPKEVEELELLK